jgi:hypothetical protein
MKEDQDNILFGLLTVCSVVVTYPCCSFLLVSNLKTAFDTSQQEVSAREVSTEKRDLNESTILHLGNQTRWAD